jgi:beta-phosphoglucomutase
MPETMRSIAAVIFDLDGVLADTIDLHYRSWQQVADDEDIPFDKSRYEQILGMNREDSVNRLLGDRIISAELKQDMLDRKNNYYLRLVESLDSSQLLPGVADLLAELQFQKIRIALGSSSKNAEFVLQRLEVRHLFEYVADGHSVEQFKPAPDVFLKAAALLQIEPAQCLVIEDAAAGVLAALAAGMKVVGVGPQERLSSADLVLPSLAGYHWDDILSKLAAADISN